MAPVCGVPCIPADPNSPGRSLTQAAGPAAWCKGYGGLPFEKPRGSLANRVLIDPFTAAYPKVFIIKHREQWILSHLWDALIIGVHTRIHLHLKVTSVLLFLGPAWARMGSLGQTQFCSFSVSLETPKQFMQCQTRPVPIKKSFPPQHLFLAEIPWVTAP